MSARPYDIVIGLEVHVQLATRTKAFCACPTAFGEPENTQVCPVCLGMPGSLPVMNKRVVEMAVALGLATGCAINRESVFARKNYFYPDLPKGYQISQYDRPLCEHGKLPVVVGDTLREFGITRIHIEEDAGKSMHGGGGSLIDYNRTGVPLLEVVSEPDFRDVEEVTAYLKTMRRLVRRLGISDGNMEEGSLRCDANVSVRPTPADPFGTRTELKNINSFRFIARAIEYEAARQWDALEHGEAIVQETRLYDAEKGRTYSMRGKEEAHDYRYFPDPDLLPLIVEDDLIEVQRAALPELPWHTHKRFVEKLGLSAYDAAVLTGDDALADYFEAVLKCDVPAKLAANWVSSELLGALKQRDLDLESSPIPPARLAGLVALIASDKITGRIAKDVLSRMFESDKSAEDIVAELGVTQIADESEIEKVVDEVIAESPMQVEQYRAGKQQVFAYFVGQVMKKTRGQANPKITQALLKKRLEG
ncbi:Asp-tRNA(Asn)/Glu-tRNA(Gln) amidotransferase subunit GatB [bacterium]|nr:Asp-tRNA(Asn)/Glu-tRNA(Gln) amidotransferase subunit GatB [bacterium]